MYKLLVGGCFVVVALMTACATPEPESSTKVSGQFVSDGADWDREISDEEVEAFANVYIKVNAIQQQTHPEIQRAEGGAREALVEERDERIEQVISDHGMTVQQFNTIVVRLPEDDELRGRVQQRVASQEEERLRSLEEEYRTQEEQREEME